jgi:uncharacterized protein with HEPN domain
MPRENRDAAYIWDMLDAARTIHEFTAGVSLEDYLLDRKLQLAVERAIEIIGEAARLVSPELRTQYPEIPWRQIVAQRNVLAHDYGRSSKIGSGWWRQVAFRI